MFNAQRSMFNFHWALNIFSLSREAVAVQSCLSLSFTLVNDGFFLEKAYYFMKFEIVA